MKFRMRVDDIFEIGNKTIFAGDLMAADGIAIDGKCFLQVDGVNLAEIEIKGEVSSGSPCRDLWTDEVIGISRKDLQGSDVWLVSE